MKIDRRRFLGFSIGAAAGTTLGLTGGRLLTQALAAAELPIYPPRGPESFALSVCTMCPGGCGLRVRRIGERAVKIEGNPLHPVNGGRLCPKGHGALQSLYHPDRIPGPLHRVGPRGSIGSFERVSWDRALDEISERLRSLRGRSVPESLVLVRGGPGGIGGRLARRYVAAFGSPNDVQLERGDAGGTLALRLTQGVAAVPAWDLASADYVLSLGSALLEATGSPVHFTRAYGQFRQGRTGRRGKLVQVEPRLSITGASADEWIAVRPGTEGIFALGVAGVLVGEGLYNREFLLERSRGFEDDHGRPGLRTILARDYGLERVSDQTGVPVDSILRIAREFAASPRSLAVGPRKGPIVPGRVFDHLAAQVLNALAGAIDAPGGALVCEDVPLAPWPALPADRVAEAGRRRPRLDSGGSRELALVASSPEQLAEAILTKSPYPAEAVFLLGADPAFASSAPERFAAALERVPLVVSFSGMPDDSALLSDWILPEAHFLERWDLQTTPPGVPYPLVSLAQPALAKPVHDARSAAAIFLELARRTGPEVAAAFPWKDEPTLLKSEIDGLYQARRGALMGTPFDEAWARMMEGAGWWAPGYSSAEELWKRAQESGGWWDPFYDHADWKRVLQTESGRFEFHAELLAADPRRASAGVPATDDASAQKLPLLLFEPLPVAGGSGAELPFLQRILDPGHEEAWETWVELNPETAARLHVHDREAVRVQSGQGAITARARVTPRVVPGVAAIPVGLGKRGGGRWAAGVGSNPLRLLAGARDPLSGAADPVATLVQVTRAGAAEMPAAKRRA